MAYHRIHRYTSIGRPLEPKYPSNKAVLLLMPLAAVFGGTLAWLDGESAASVLLQGGTWILIVFGSWALARELFPDDNIAAFISVALAVLAAFSYDTPGVLIMFATLGLARIVNRSTGLSARKMDSIVVMLLTFWVIYATQSPFFGGVAALAFALDGSLRNPLRHQWVFALICFGGMVVYMVDHDVGLELLTPPDTLIEWVSLMVLLVFALDILLLKKVRSVGDVHGGALNPGRVRGGMTVGLFAGLQGLLALEDVILVIASIGGIVLGMAFRKAFQAPASG